MILVLLVFVVQKFFYSSKNHSWTIIIQLPFDTASDFLAVGAFLDGTFTTLRCVVGVWTMSLSFDLDRDLGSGCGIVAFVWSKSNSPENNQNANSINYNCGQKL